MTVGKDEFGKPFSWDFRAFTFQAFFLNEHVVFALFYSLTRKLLFEIFSTVDIVWIWNELTHWQTDFTDFFLITFYTPPVLIHV
jgi:hypothetical protein